MRISWIGLSDRLDHELKQLQEEGRDVTELVHRWEKVKGQAPADPELEKKADELYSEIDREGSDAKDFPLEPSTWQLAKELYRIGPDVIPSYPSQFMEDRVLGGWCGRAAGCLLGKPVEKIQRPGIKEILLSNNTWPLREYITEQGIPHALLQRYPWNRHSGRESLKENIVCMAEDDDMNYPMLNLHVVETYGNSFTPEQVAGTWLEMLPVLSTFTAERVAYVNSLSGMKPPATALHRNPYREWIGAQIRADVWGWTSPSQPARAAELAWRDASVSHIRNGIYGEVFFAAAIAASFDSRDMRGIIGTALRFIPPQSLLAAAIRFVLKLPVGNMPWEETVDRLYEAFGSYHWVHTINNAALVVAALLSSDNQFDRAICNVVMGGWDTDSNGATVGSIMGTMLGFDALPQQWIEPLHNRIRSSLKGFDNARFTDLSHRTVDVAQFHLTQ